MERAIEDKDGEVLAVSESTYYHFTSIIIFSSIITAIALLPAPPYPELKATGELCHV